MPAPPANPNLSDLRGEWVLIPDPPEHPDMQASILKQAQEIPGMIMRRLCEQRPDLRYRTMRPDGSVLYGETYVPFPAKYNPRNQMDVHLHLHSRKLLIEWDGIPELLRGRTLVQLCEFEYDGIYTIDVWTSGRHVIGDRMELNSGYSLFALRKYARALGVACQRVRADEFVATHRTWMSVDDICDDVGAMTSSLERHAMANDAAQVLEALTGEAQESGALSLEDVEWALRRIQQYKRESE